MKSKVAVFIDKLALTVAIWLITAYIFRYFVHSLALLLLVATAVTGLVMLLLKGKSKPKEDYSPIYEFMYMDQTAVNAHFAEFLSRRYQVEVKDGYLAVGKAAVFLYLNSDKVDLKTMVEILAVGRRDAQTKIVVMTLVGLSAGAEEAVARSELNVAVLKEKEVYALCKAFKALPAKPEKKKMKFKNFLKIALSRDRVRGYALTACMLLVFSLFTAYSVYYVVVAALCLTLSLLSRIDIVKIVESKR